MDFFSLVQDVLFGFFIRTYNYMVTWYQNATDAGFIISQGSLISTIIWMIILCGSAMTAMTFAEIKFINTYFVI